MSSVDDRIVNMQFNNDQFKRGATDSKKSLTDLENAVTKAGKARGLEDMGKGADSVKNKFSALRVAGVAAVATVASKVTLAGINMVKSFTLAPIMDGFREYETNLKSIQTIMANTGAGLPQVTGYLRELNEYSDQTIYNFSEMAKNIGTFTAAGVDLKTSVSAIKGISNIAALSGSSSQQASTAMYQLSQAISAGRVGLQDWNSVVNAGMGGSKLRTALVTTGLAMGTVSQEGTKLTRNMKVMGASFRDSIAAKPGEQSWLTSDVLVKTLAIMDGRLSKAAIEAENFGKGSAFVNAELKKQQDILRKQGYNEQQIKNLTQMADAAYQSATVVKSLPQLMGVIKESIGSVWAQAFEQILGNFNESKKLWTSVSVTTSSLVGAFGDSLLGTLIAWRKEGGRDAVIEGFKNGFTALGKVLGAVKDAFRDVFPANSASALATFSKGFRDFTAALIPSENTIESIRSIFGGFFAVLHLGVSIFKGVAGAFAVLVGSIFGGSIKARGGILEMIAGAAEAVKAFDRWLTSNDRIVSGLQLIGTVAGTVIKPILSAIGAVAEAFIALASGGGIEGFTAPFKELGSAVGDTVARAAGGMAQFTEKIEWLSNIFDMIRDKARQFSDSMGGVQDKVTGVQDSFRDAGDQIKDLSGGMTTVNAVTGKVSTSFGKVQKFSSSAIESVTGMFKAFQGSDVVGAVVNTEKLASAGESAGSKWETIKHIFSIIGSGIKATFSALGEAASWAIDALGNLFSGMDAFDITALINAIFSGALILTIRNYVGVFSGFGKSVTGSFDQLTGTLKSMQKQVRSQMIMQIAIAIGVLAASLLVLSFIPLEKLAISLGAVTVMLVLMVMTLKAVAAIESDLKLAVVAASLFVISASLILLAAAIAIFGNMDIETLAKGLGAMAIGLYILSSAVNSFSGIEGKVGTAALAITILSFAMTLLAGAVLAFGSMSLETLAVGLGSMAIALTLVTTSLMLLTAIGPGVAAAALGVLLVAQAMVVLSVAVLAFGNMDLATLAVGFAAVTFALILFTASLLILGGAGPAILAAGGAMIMMATAMAMLVPVIATLGSMSLGTLATGIGALAVILVVFVAALAAVGAVASVVGPGLIMLGVALALMGVGMLAFGAGFALMAAAGTAGVAVLVVAFHALMALMPVFAMQVASAFVTFLEVIAKASPRIRAAASVIIKNLLATVRDAVPQFRALFQSLVNAGIRVLNDSIPRFVDMGFNVIDRFLKSADKKLPGIINTASSLVVKFMQGMGNNAGRIADAGAKMIVQFVNATARAINNNVDAMREAGLNLAYAIVNGMTGGLLGRGVEMVRSAAATVANAIPGPIQKIMGIASPSKLAHYWGEMIGAGLAGGMIASIKMAVGAAVTMANAVIAAGDNVVDLASERAREKQFVANRAQSLADAANYAAARTASKTQKKALLILAASRKKSAEAAQKAADEAQAEVTKAKEFAAADLGGKGDIRSTQAIEDAATAAKLLAKASADYYEYKRLARYNKTAAAALLASSKKAQNDALTYAERAKSRQKSSLEYYAQEVAERIAGLQAVKKAEEDEKRAQAELDAADGDAQYRILTTRAELNEKKASAAAALAASLVAQAQALAATNAVEAMKLLDRSEEQAALAKELADKARAEREQSLQANAGNVTAISPSASVLADAASAVDRYTLSLAAAQAAAQSEQTPVQFIQNNTSPAALTASELYRQTHNLLSAQEIKMGANSS